ncbi:hypothetical protein NOF55_20865 [Rhizobiaceae bacterium BDR2-2]|uniref:Uncharacterized protein n=1 Tax=Ectorhizobium quercum TaxID=2965071 RepID=A0AAE3N3K9_9HYPH|nr:hypothetical protein [Ectorhizobium quercum]MCX8999561.1 hypothetical protein [Ectorhizobium quercum]
MRNHRVFKMTENGAGNVTRSLSAPPSQVVVVEIGVTRTDRRQVGNRPPFPERRLRHVEIGPVVLPKQPFGLLDRAGTGMDGPFPPRPVTITDALRERYDTVADAAVAAAVGMQVFEVLARTKRAVVESVEPNLLTLMGMKVRRPGWLICQPPAQLPVLWGFTMATPTFSILEHTSKTAGGFQPVDGGLFMVMRRRAWVKRRRARRAAHDESMSRVL